MCSIDIDHIEGEIWIVRKNVTTITSLTTDLLAAPGKAPFIELSVCHTLKLCGRGIAPNDGHVVHVKQIDRNKNLSLYGAKNEIREVAIHDANFCDRPAR